MGFWDFDWLPWARDDKKEPTAAGRAALQSRTAVSPQVLKNSGNPNKNVRDYQQAYQPRRWNTGAGTPAATRGNSSYRAPFRPEQASRATQRYLREVGWNPQGWKPLRQADTEMDFQQDSLRDLDAHEYSLTEWQQEQAELNFGIRAPEKRRQLRGPSVRTGRLTPEAMEALSPQQRNALKFNDRLIAAVEADRAMQRPDDTGDYDNRVREMFGTQGGSDAYAPNTIELLDKMGMGRLRGQDLDEYLSLDRAFDVEEIKALQPWDETPSLEQYQGFGKTRTAEAGLALDRVQIDRAGELLDKALADRTTYAWSDEARIDKYLGREFSLDEVPIGWYFTTDEKGPVRGTDLDTKKELFFQNAYDYLSSEAGESLDPFWEQTEALEFTDADYDEIFDYFYLRSLEDDRIGPVEGRRTGQQVRDFIGIG